MSQNRTVKQTQTSSFWGTVFPAAGRKKAVLLLLVSVSLAAWVVLDRAAWASVSQWREDQAVNLWLGYVRQIDKIPVGLISSQGYPNPNGMVLLGSLISRLPGLWFISAFLGVLQAFLLVILCWNWFGKSRLFLIGSAVLLSSVVLRAISIEFWNQWILLYLNILFFIIAARYLSKPSTNKIPPLIFVSILAPSLYLGGVMNGIAYFVLFAILMLITRQRLDTRRWLFASILSLSIIVFFLLVTWVPYLQSLMADGPLPFLSGRSGSITRQLIAALVTLLGYVGWGITWPIRLIPSVMFFDGSILPPSARILVFLHNFCLVYMTLISIMTISYAGLTSFKARKNFSETFLPQYKKQGQLVILGYGFILFVFTLTALLKGPFWANGERTDMTLQFLPFFLIIWFASPSMVQLPDRFRSLIRPVSMVLAGVFVVVNCILGWVAVTSLQNYRGEVLPLSDVPIYQKLEAVKFVAQDWSAKSKANEVPVYYDFEVVLPSHQKEIYGLDITPWYPAPYTLGRALDYELLRMYQLRNTQEGVLNSQRKKELAVYIVHYAFLPSPYSPDCYDKHTFGRISVSVRREDAAGCSNP